METVAFFRKLLIYGYLIGKCVRRKAIDIYRYKSILFQKLFLKADHEGRFYFDFAINESRGNGTGSSSVCCSSAGSFNIMVRLGLDLVIATAESTSDLCKILLKVLIFKIYS